MVLRCWDQDVTSSDAVGFTKIKMSSLMINCGIEDWFTIMYENKPAGEILIKSQFEPVGGNEYEALQEKLEEQNKRLEEEAEQARAQIEALEKQQADIDAKLQETQADLESEREMNEAEKEKME